MKPHVLDANALYRFLMNKPGAEIVNRLFKEARNAGIRHSISVINWGEVYYTIAKKDGFQVAERIMEAVQLLPVEVVAVTKSEVIVAARLKAGFGLPYADCFAAALAGTGFVLVTAGWKDFRKVPRLQILALPEHKSKP